MTPPSTPAPTPVSITWVDAFTAVPFAGNPAGVCLLNEHEPMPEERMQALATELGIAETAYVTPSADDPLSFGLRWFSPGAEVPLCGHATLATAHALRRAGVVDGTAPVTFHTLSGPLVVTFDGAPDAPARISMDFPAAPLIPAALPESLRHQWPGADVVATGTTASGFFSVVVLANEAAVRDYRPDLAAIAAAGTPAVLITAPADSERDADCVVRVFGPNVGIDEDPATGSAQCTTGPYWAEALGLNEVVTHQLSQRGALLSVRPAGERVHILGQAVTIFVGELC
jgi:PhzF family phenazine biosynthesis protein